MDLICTKCHVLCSLVTQWGGARKQSQGLLSSSPHLVKESPAGLPEQEAQQGWTEGESRARLCGFSEGGFFQNGQHTNAGVHTHPAPEPGALGSGSDTRDPRNVRKDCLAVLRLP